MPRTITITIADNDSDVTVQSDGCSTNDLIDAAALCFATAVSEDMNESVPKFTAMTETMEAFMHGTNELIATIQPKGSVQ